jgi:hypothetical protein
VKAEKHAARSRKYRAARSTGRKRGRPKSEGVPAWVAAGFSSERSYYRHKARGTTAAQSGSKNASRDISNNRKRDGISLPPESGAPQARPRLAPLSEIDAGAVACGLPRSKTSSVNARPIVP